MSDQFIGEIRIFGFAFPPYQWATCNGQLFPVSQYTALFSILGTNYGGDGRVSFALPNLTGACAVNQGQGPGLSQYDVGESGGTASVALSMAEMGAHTHSLNAVNAQGSTTTPLQNQLAISTGGTKVGGTQGNLYSAQTGALRTALSPNAILPAGEGAAHSNLMPCVVMNFCIALNGEWPSRP